LNLGGNVNGSIDGKVSFVANALGVAKGDLSVNTEDEEVCVDLEDVKVPSLDLSAGASLGNISAGFSFLQIE
jgi:hypothetical protein